MAGLSLALFGTVSATVDGKELSKFRTRLAQALLIYLVCQPERHGRESLMALLWPNLSQNSAQQNLRQNLYYLRKAIPNLLSVDGGWEVPLLLSDHSSVQLNPEAEVELDIDIFTELLDREEPTLERLAEVVSLYRGEFLSDFYLPDSNPFEEWAAARRELYQRKVLDALELLTRGYMQGVDYQAAENYARQAIAIDQLHEVANRQLIEILARSGRRSAALVQYDNYRQLLKAELGVEPGSETLLLLEAVESGELEPTAERPGHIRSYELREELGHGSFGVVYRALQPSIGRDVAIKVIPSEFADKAGFIRRFETEAQLISRLEHPRIVPLYDYWREPGNAYLVMRYLRRGNLKISLEQGPWSLEKSVQLVEQLAAALHTAHRKGIVHCDVKPANILLDEESNGYLSDFGVARLFELEGAELPFSTITGTPEYLSPEQVRDDPVTPLSDQYSLGAVIYEMLTGKPPFAADSLVDLLEMHVNAPLPSVHDQRSEVARKVDEVLGRATAKVPEDRYPDILHFAKEFRAAAYGEALQTEEQTARLEIGNPYKGLLPFTEVDAEIFFGREAMVKHLVAQLDESNDDNRFLAIVGPSGSGKSSLVKAGLVPTLRRGAIPGSENWYINDMTPGVNPFEELATALLQVAIRPSSSLPAQLQTGGSGLLQAAQEILPEGDANQLLLIIDQFEELFTLVSEGEVTDLFLDNIFTAVTAPNIPLRIIITLRADFYDRPLLHPGISELLQQHTEVIVPLSTDELVQVIERPATLVGVQVEPDLVAALVADLSEQPGALPLLQHALCELFEQREKDRMTLAAYHQLGGIKGALSQGAEAAYLQLDEGVKNAARQVFLRLISLGEGGEDTRRRVLQTELEALTSRSQSSRTMGVLEILDSFSRARLLFFDRDPVTRGPTVEIAHEALLDAWPRLRDWMDENRAQLRLGRLLTQAALEWESAGREEGFLLRGARLDQLAPLASGEIALTNSERDYLATSLAARQARLEAEEVRRQEEIATAQRLAVTEKKRAADQSHAASRLKRRAAFLASALVLATVLALAAIFFGTQAQQNADLAENERSSALASEATAVAETEVRATAEAIAKREQVSAEEQARLATSRELAQIALNSLETDAELSILLALQALENAAAKEAQEALHQALQASRTLMTLNNVTDIVNTPGGPLMVTVGEGEITILNTEAENEVQALPFTAWDPDATYDVFTDLDGENLRLLSWITGKDEISLQTWNLAEGRRIDSHALPIQLDTFSGLTLSPDGQMLAVGYEDGTSELWDTQSGRRQLTLSDHGDWVWSVTFDEQGDRLATVSPDGQVSIWDVPGSIAEDAGQLLTSLEIPGQIGRPRAFAFVDETRVAVGTHIGWVQLWDLEDNETPLFSHHAHNNVVHHLSLSTDRSQLVSANEDGIAKIWDVETGELLLTLDGSISSVYRAYLNPNGTRLTTMGEEGEGRVWNVRQQAQGELGSFTASPLTLNLELSPDGELMATGSEVTAPSLWNPASGELLHTFEGSEGGVFRVDFSPDGTRLAGVGRDNIIRIWEVSSGEILLELAGHGPGTVAEGLFSGTMDVAFSPDGSRIATAGADGVVKVWEVETGEQLLAFTSHTAGLMNLAYSADGRFVATSSYRDDGTVRVWDVERGEPKFVLRGHVGDIWGLEFSPDGSRLVSGSDFGIVKVWSMETGHEIYSLPGLTVTTFDIVFTPDGKYFITTEEALRVWRAEDGEEVLTLYDQLVYFVTISPDGRRVYAVDIQDTVQVFTLQLQDTIDLAHERLTRWWRLEECRRYLRRPSCPPAPAKFSSNE